MECEWIKFEKQKPKDRQYVIVSEPFISTVFPGEPRHVLQWDGKCKEFQYFLGDSVHNPYGDFHPSHWMPLPQPPGTK
jgi:hypothetical protein